MRIGKFSRAPGREAKAQESPDQRMQTTQSVFNAPPKRTRSDLIDCNDLLGFTNLAQLQHDPGQFPSL